MTGEPYRRNHYDVTNRILVADPATVRDEVVRVVSGVHPDAEVGPLERAFDVFAHLFAGEHEGYVGCDTWYHDAQHSLDCTLVMARLAAGHDMAARAGEELGARRLVLGLIAALFHDAGYIRHRGDPESHGAEFTLYHVRRSGSFLAEFLDTVGYGDRASMSEQLVHFTGYEVALDRIEVHEPLDRRLGFLLGTADLLAQMSDRCYLEKCRDCLYPEFEICGLAGDPREGGPDPVYGSPEDLLRQTPLFIDQVWADRLDGYFESVYRHAETFFGGDNPYLDAIRSHLARLDLAQRTEGIYRGLRRRVECINAGPLRVILGLRDDDEAAREQARPPAPGNLRRCYGVGEAVPPPV